MRSMLLLEDVSLAKGARFGDPTTLAITKDLAASLVDQLATYHASYWSEPSLSRHSWLPSSLEFQLRVNEMIDFRKRSMIGVSRLQPAMQPEHVSLANIERMAAAIEDLESFDAVQSAT